jgi:DUF4097 and DUF4098 domain-containing protein YvlB
MVLRIVFAFLLLPLSWQQTEPAAQKSSGAKTPYTEKSEKEFAFYPGGKIVIAAAAPGSFTIAGWDKASVRVEMEKIFYYLSSEEAQALAKRYPIRVTYTATTARISTGGAAQPGATMENNVQIFVPRDRTDLGIKMVKGDLSIASLRGSVEATLQEGNIEAKDLAGYFSLRTERGDFNVDLSGPRWTGYGFWGKTTQGSIQLKLPVIFSAALQLGAKNGKISVDYPEQMVEGESVPLKILEKKKAASVSTPIGTGGAPINLMTLSGNIVFTGKK